MNLRLAAIPIILIITMMLLSLYFADISDNYRVRYIGLYCIASFIFGCISYDNKYKNNPQNKPYFTLTLYLWLALPVHITSKLLPRSNKNP
jgi:peptidoglycan/LPS O-acetylase OafA/YrhL